WFYFLAGLLVTAACGQTPSNRTQAPPPTLQGYTPSASSLLPPLIRPSITSTPLRVYSGGLPTLNLVGALCQESPTRALICLGWVHNPHSIAYENIRVRVQLVDDRGNVVATQSTTL